MVPGFFYAHIPPFSTFFLRANVNTNVNICAPNVNICSSNVNIRAPNVNIGATMFCVDSYAPIFYRNPCKKRPDSKGTLPDSHGHKNKGLRHA